MNPFRDNEATLPVLPGQADGENQGRGAATGPYPAPAVTPHDRVLAAAAALVLLVPLVVACFLEPDTSGHGTHRQLGLPPCTLVAVCGVRCPTCGMTTSWAAVVRGRILDALAANVGGVLLALAVVGSIAGLVTTALRGHRPRWFPNTNGLAWIGTAIAAVTLIDWIVRILLF